MSIRPRPRFALSATAAAVAMALLASAAFGSAAHAKKRVPRSTPPAPAAVPAPPAPAVPGSFGLAAFLDPDTGLLTGPISSLVPPADQRAAATTVVLEPVQLPGGAWLLDLKGTGMESYVLHIDALGQRTVTCVQDPHAPAVVPAAAAAPARKER